MRCCQKRCGEGFCRAAAEATPTLLSLKSGEMPMVKLSEVDSATLRRRGYRLRTLTSIASHPDC